MALSRRQVARYAAKQIHDGVEQEKIAHILAAYIIDAKAQRSVELLVSEIERILADEYGHVLAHVTSAYSLSDDMQKIVDTMVGLDKTLEVTNTVDKSILGGVVVRIPGKEFDGSVASSIKKLKTIGS